MSEAEIFLQKKIQERTEKGLLRTLTKQSFLSDFCSNDYLGFARSPLLRDKILLQNQQLQSLKINGSGGSRLLSGNDAYTEDTEQFIANFHGANSGLIFNSGYDANIGLISSVPQRGDTIIMDELVHASLIDGARLSHATRYKFKHNDLKDLEQKLKNALGLCYVVVESVYSMDGDTSPLTDIQAICEKYNAHLIVDEAHAVGVFGPHGKGLVVQFNLENKIFARIVTFGKALGTSGAIILGSAKLRQYLLNFARSFIYTTAAPVSHIVAINCAYQALAEHNYTLLIKAKIKYYQQCIQSENLNIQSGNSCIQTVRFNHHDLAKKAALHLQDKGFDVRAILHPTVAPGTERLRICLHTYNSETEISDLIKQLKTLI